jgi:DNA-binding response OmpR family regulator
VADILLVDNDARLSELMAWFLVKRGHAVRRALSYAQAREHIAEREPELMLADLELGRERGREELSRMHREGKLPRTLVVSGYLDRETEASLAELPSILGTVRKPFALEDLERTIETCVRATPAADGRAASTLAATNAQAGAARAEPRSARGADA